MTVQMYTLTFPRKEESSTDVGQPSTDSYQEGKGQHLCTSVSVTANGEEWISKEDSVSEGIPWVYYYLYYLVFRICVSYVVGSKSFRPDQLFKVTEIKQICYFST